tara:strand:+ start:457 stop:609 length:153 start_codon:yes stop_codon:yes gene_type:complete
MTHHKTKVVRVALKEVDVVKPMMDIQTVMFVMIILRFLAVKVVNKGVERF